MAADAVRSAQGSTAASVQQQPLAFYQSSTGQIYDLNPKSPKNTAGQSSNAKGKGEKRQEGLRVRIGKMKPGQRSAGSKSFQKEQSEMSKQAVKYLRQSLLLNQQRREREALMAVSGGAKTGELSELGQQNLNIETEHGEVHDYSTSPLGAVDLKKELLPGSPGKKEKKLNRRAKSVSRARNTDANADLITTTQFSGQESKGLVSKMSRGLDQEYLIKNNYSIFDQDIDVKSLCPRAHRSLRAFDKKAAARPSTAFMTQGRNQKKVQQDTTNLAQFFRSRGQQCSFEKNISSLAYRDRTLKTRGQEQPYDLGYQNFSDLVKQKQDIASKLQELQEQSTPGTAHRRLKTATQHRHDLMRFQSLQQDYAELSQQTSEIQKQMRTIRSNWRNGIVGVEQPGDQQSNIFAEQGQRAGIQYERHSQSKQNRLQSK